MNDTTALILIGVIALGLLLFTHIITSIYKSSQIDKDDKTYSNQASYEQLRLAREEEERCLLDEIKQQAFWSGAYRHIQEFAHIGDIDLAYQMAINVWNDKDQELYAYELHSLLDYTIEILYKYKDDPDCKMYILELGSLALSVHDEASKQYGGQICARYPHRMAIILEIDGRIDEAIAFSEMCLSRGIQDYHINKTFEDRISRLKKKALRRTKA